MITPRRLKELYDEGQNISALLRQERGLDHNTREIIEMAYDLQTGSYVQAMGDEKMARHKAEYSAKIAAAILSLCQPESVLEAGVGEATTLSGVLGNLEGRVSSYGFDLSWSRVAYAKRWLHDQGLNKTVLCSGDLLAIPFADNSVDVVYTSHSIEPNRGSEEPILRELHRVARRYLILLEPGYELASEEARHRMDQHGYCRNLKGTAESLGYSVLDHRLFPVTVNPLNPTALTVIRKESRADPPAGVLACPRFKTPLKEMGGMLFSPEALTVYPVIGGIPCLRVENGILASKYEEVVPGDG
jgi:uncharacterized protein YbaR (Trm112 family)